MEDRLYHHLNGGGIIPEDIDGPLLSIIHSIGGGILIPQRTDTELDTISLGPQVCFAPPNCFAYNSPNLMYSHVRGRGL